MVFFSYMTKRESPAGDQFWKFRRQCSIFGRIGDQWVAISSPAHACGLVKWTKDHLSNVTITKCFKLFDQMFDSARIYQKRAVMAEKGGQTVVKCLVTKPFSFGWECNLNGVLPMPNSVFSARYRQCAHGSSPTRGSRFPRVMVLIVSNCDFFKC